jgi:biotin carboxyl carrier protein
LRQPGRSRPILKLAIRTRSPHADLDQDARFVSNHGAGELARWLVKVGDTVSAGDIMAEIETDKATMEFEAVDEGTIVAIEIAEGTDNGRSGP